MCLILFFGRSVSADGRRKTAVRSGSTPVGAAADWFGRDGDRGGGVARRTVGAAQTGDALRSGRRRSPAASSGRAVERLGSRAVVGVRLRPEAQPGLSRRYDPLVGGQRRNLARVSRRGGQATNAVLGGADIPVCRVKCDKRGRQECPPHRRKELPPRPLRLLPRPIAVNVTAIAPDWPPLRFQLDGCEHEVAAKLGAGADRNRLAARPSDGPRLFPRRDGRRRPSLALPPAARWQMVFAWNVRVAVTFHAALDRGSIAAAYVCGDNRSWSPACGRSAASFDRCFCLWSWLVVLLARRRHSGRRSIANSSSAVFRRFPGGRRRMRLHVDRVSAVFVNGAIHGLGVQQRHEIVDFARRADEVLSIGAHQFDDFQRFVFHVEFVSLRKRHGATDVAEGEFLRELSANLEISLQPLRSIGCRPSASRSSKTTGKAGP